MQAGQTLQNYRSQAMTPQKQPYVQGGTPGLFETAAPYAGQALVNRYSNNYRQPSLIDQAQGLRG